MNSKALSLVAVLMATMLVPGCAINRIDLVEKGVVSVETCPKQKG